MLTQYNTMKKILIEESEKIQILLMHEALKKKKINEQVEDPNLTKLRDAISNGCLSGGKLKFNQTKNLYFYRKPSAQNPGKEVDFFPDMTYKFTDGSKSGKWKCDFTKVDTDKAAQEKIAQDKSNIEKQNQAAISGNIEKVKKEGDWKTYDELIKTDTKENISNPAMYEKKVIDGIELYRRKVSGGIGDALTDDQQKIVDKWKTQGAKLRKELDPEQAKTWTSKVVSPASEGYFSQDLIMYFPPSTITNTEITSAFQQAVQDQTPQDSKDCKTTIEAYYMAFKKKKQIEPNMLNAMKEKVQACKNEFYGNWGTFGGGKTIDSYLDALNMNSVPGMWKLN